MLILSAGMPKSGSTYMFHLLNGLVMAGGFPDSLALRDRHALGGLLGTQHNFAAAIPTRALAKLWLVGAKEGRLVVKTHDPLPPAAKLAGRFLGLRVIYTYRDPRDCVLSALDYGVAQRARGAGDSYFGKMHTFDDAFRAVKVWLATWRAYQAVPGALSIKYEDLLAEPDEILDRCAHALRVRVDAEARRKILWSYSRDNPDVGKVRMPLNKAVAFRYRQEMPPEQRQRFRDELGDSLVRMGYALD